MQTALLATKLFIPPVRPGTVQRPRLLEKLSGALNCSLTLVSAPAGFGKTTLISEWVHQTKPPIPTAWLSLEESENDPVRFWQYLIAALRTVQPEIAEAAQSLLRSSQPVPTESAVTALVNDIAGIRSDVLLVLDDYHFINSEAVHKGVAFLLNHLPPMVHLIIATRVDPPLPVAHFRGKGMLSEIRTDDLRFMPEETAKLLSVPGRARLSPENVDALNARTGGWVVGLKMASLSMPEGKDVAAFVAEFAGTQRYVMDYLMEEVLERQTEDRRRFLLQTSVLDRLTGPLCDAITGGRYGSEMLLSLEKANLFVVPLDESSQWYRYEHLFAELLRHRLQIEMGKQAVEELQKRASHWYESNGFHESAINHALASRDWGLAVDLIAASRPTSVAAYGGATTLNWLRQVPEGILLARPEGWTQYAWALGFTGQLDAEKAFLDRYEKSPAYDPATAGQIALLRTHVGSYQGDPRTEEYARKALSLLPQRGDNVLLGVVRLHLGIYYVLRQRFSEAEDALTEACESFRGIDDGFAISQALTYLAIATTMRGGLHRGEEMLRQAVLKAPHHPNTAIAHMYLAIIHFWWNDLDTSASELKKALALNPPPVFLRMLYLYSALRPLVQGDVTAAAEALEKAEAVPAPNTDTVKERARIAAYHVALAIEQGDSESISRWLDRMTEYDGFLGDIPADLMAEPTIPSGHTEGFHDAFARLHRCFEADVRAYLGGKPYQCDGSKYATVEDGRMGIYFISKAVESSSQGGTWLDM